LKGQVSVRQICAILGISRSWYYAGEVDAPMDGETALRDRIEAIVLEFPGYGYRPVTKTLQREGLTVNHKRVLRIMRAESLLCHLKRRWVATTNSRHELGSYPNRIKGVAISMAAIGNPYENTQADAFFKALKTEEVYLKEYVDFSDAERQLGHFIDADYVAKRLHSALAYRPPAEFEQIVAVAAG
jgi:putative transposase